MAYTSPEDYLRKLQSEYGHTPEEITVSEEDFQRQYAEARRTMRGHNWRAAGTEVYCTSCPFRHGFFKAPDDILIGIDAQGNPIIEKAKGGT